MIDQITVFLENKKGRVASVARTIADAGVNMTALSLADSEEYGLARIVCGEPERALKALGEAGYRAKVVKVAAVAVPDRPGGLAELFEALDELDVGLVHLPEELTGVGGQGLHVAALSLGEDRVEGQRGLARARQSGEDDHRVARQVQVDALEIVLAGPTDDERVVHGIRV